MPDKVWRSRVLELLERDGGLIARNNMGTDRPLPSGLSSHDEQDGLRAAIIRSACNPPELLEVRIARCRRGIGVEVPLAQIMVAT
jgi:hypothetical protein